MYIFKAGVVGAGAMGAGIAQVVTYAGLPVVLKDIDQKMLDRGMEQIRGIYQRRVDKGKMSISTMQEKLDLVTPTLSYDDFADVDEFEKSLSRDRACPAQGSGLQRLL